MIDWLWGLVGGLMIGSAAALYLLGNGRIMGASGILGGMIDGTGRTAERAAFLFGLVAVPGVLTLLTGGRPTNLTAEWPVLVAAGLLVGLGTRLANGCTSGHGVCGISRLSRRGIVATAAYLGAGFLAMAVLRHGLGWV